jgi:quercetin dioxygenase-like cupin family protein
MPMDNEDRYIRKLDKEHLARVPEAERYVEKLLSAANGAANCTVSYIRTEAGGGSPEGLHTHEVDQIFYVMQGEMNIEVEGEQAVAEAGSLVIFPAGVPHRNWNSSPRPSVHLAISAPVPPQGRPFATKVDIAAGHPRAL